jgi:hypothetical protein
MPLPLHSSRFYHPHIIGWGVQIIQLLFMLYYTVLIRRLIVIHINWSFWFYSVGSHNFTIFTSSEHKTFVHPTTNPSVLCIAEVK